MAAGAGGAVTTAAYVGASTAPVEPPPVVEAPVVAEVVPEPPQPLPAAPPVIPAPLATEQAWTVNVGAFGTASPTVMAFNNTSAFLVVNGVGHLAYTEDGVGHYYRGPLGSMVEVASWPGRSSIGLDAADGRLAMVWVERGNVYVAEPADGIAWSSPTKLGSGSAPSVAVTGTRAYATWHDGTEAAGSVWFAWADGGKWSTAEKVSATKAARFASVDANADGVLVAWRGSDDGSTWGVRVLEGGKDRATGLAGKDPGVLLEANNRARLTWQLNGEVQTSVSVDGARSWSTPVSVARGLFGSAFTTTGGTCWDLEAPEGAPTDDARKRVGLACVTSPATSPVAVPVGDLGAVYPACASDGSVVWCAWVDRNAGVMRVERAE
jgi:hypothetical protein